MKPRTPMIVEEFEHRLRKEREKVWQTVARTEKELATLESHQAGAATEDAARSAVAEVLSRLDGAERHLLDAIDAAQARLAAGTFGICVECGKALSLARLRAIPMAPRCIACEHAAERATGIAV